MKAQIAAYLSRFLRWRVRNMSMQNFVLLISVGVGLLAGLAAIILKTLIALLEAFTHEKVPAEVFLLLPMVGILLTQLLVRNVLRDPGNYGVTDVLLAVSRKQGIIPRVKTYSRMLGAAITVAFGGSVGLEAPIFVTGSALGSNVGRWMHLDARRRTLMIGCGAAAGMAAIFNCPVAGIIFAMEVILTEYHISSFIPLLLASAVGSLFSMSLRGEGTLFSFDIRQDYAVTDVPFFILAGILLGLVSLYFTRMSLRSGLLFRKLRTPTLRALTGGALLGILIFLLPPMFGEGYSSLTHIMNGQGNRLLETGPFREFFSSGTLPFLLFLGLLVFVKVIASSITVHAGGIGGKFGPSLFTGGFFGYLFAQAVNATGFFQPLFAPHFILAGMCGVISAVMHAPLTAIFLIAEITESYELFIPLMIVSALSYFTKTRFEPYSIYTKQLAARGDLLKDDRDKQVLAQLQTSRLVERDFQTVRIEGSLKDLLFLIETGHRNLFPVVDAENRFLGIILLDDVRPYLFHPETHSRVSLQQLMQEAPAVIREEDSMEAVMEVFDRTQAWNLPVVDEAHHFVGMVSKSTIFSSYRSRLRASTQGVLD